MAAGGGTKAIVAAFLANLGIAIAKFVGFLATRSSSMLAESIHSAADAGNQGLLLLGGRMARRPPTPQHPFGYGRERYFWSFVVAMVLFALGSVFSLIEGFEKVRHPHEIKSIGWAVAILAVGIVLESASFRTAIGEARHMKGDAGWWSFIRHSRNPELPVVLLEDAGALIGLVVAMAAVVAADVTGEAALDGVGTMTIGVLLGIIAITLAVEMKSLLIGEGAVAAQEKAIRAAIENADDVVALVHLRTQHLGPEELLVAAKVEFAPHMGVPALARAVDLIEAAVRAEVPIARVIYVEPAVHQPQEAQP